MSIKVKTKKLIARHADLPDQIRVEMLNQVVEDYAEEVLLALGDLKCNTHPTKISRVTILADRTHTLLIGRNSAAPNLRSLFR